MDDNRTIPTWQRLALVLLLLGFAFIVLFISTRSGIAHADLAPAASPNSVIEVQPVLTPTYTTLCDSNWFPITVDAPGGQTAYLTRNVSSTVESTNRGIWRPLIPEDGTYRVEAFIPSHDLPTWTCPNKTVISGDTLYANYNIHYDGGQITETVKQLPINNKWVTLGNFPFKSGSDGYVSLTDVTGEAISTTTVSFSSMRWLRNTYLPFVAKYDGKVKLTHIWTANSNGTADSVFLPSDAIRFYTTGTNTTGLNVSAELQISITGSCGKTTMIYDGLRALPGGDWTLYQDAILPADCPGTYILSVNIIYQNNISNLYSPFIVYAKTYVLSLPAFDTCTYLTPDQMQVWWNQSPYWAMNLYMGGVSAYCPTQVNATWLRLTGAQGWSFIPTWVGMQAPSGCNDLKYHMSADPTKARKQGISEANAAVDKAISLGFDAHSVIYYDMEAFFSTDACKNAVKSFVDGWVAQIHARGMTAGVYSTSCSATYWSTITNMPDDVWVANWYKINDQYYFDSGASVFGLACLSDTLWSQHQRIRQYTAGHTETWGPLAVNDIDSDVADGLVAGVPPAALTSPESNSIGSGIVSANPTFLKQPAGVSSFQPLPEGLGWAVIDNHLLSLSSNQVWQDITPPQAANSQLLSAFFLDTNEEWSVVQDNTSAQLTFLTTRNAGVTWQAATLPSPDSLPVASIALDFIDAQNGWLSIKLASSSNFSLGVLYKTADGGKSWKSLPLPVAGAVYFLNADRGWIAGGSAGDKLYVTQDGGATWRAVSLVSGSDFADPVFTSLPVFTTDQDGWIELTVADPLSPQIEIFNTINAGDTWTKRGTIPLDPALNPAGPAPSVLLDENRWLLASPGKPAIYSLQPAGLPTQPLEAALPVAGLPVGVAQIKSSNKSTSWALVQAGTCNGDKLKTTEIAPSNIVPFICTTNTSLWQTTDGGVTWVDITPPASASKTR